MVSTENIKQLKEKFQNLITKIKNCNLLGEYETRCLMIKKITMDQQMEIMESIISQFDKSNIKELKEEIMTNLILKRRAEATELIVQYIKSKNYIHTIRQDDKLEMWIYSDGIYIPEAISYIKEFCLFILGPTYTPSLCNSVIAKIEASTFINKSVFFEIKNPSRVAVKNGILDILEKKLYTFNPNEIHFNKINATFDPKIKCPAIEKHFNDVIKDKADVPILFEFFGYCLYKDYKIEKAFMLFGDGRNGKGKTVELLKRFLGPDNCCNISLEQIEKDSFGIANFQNKMANIAADISPTALKNTGNFKQLTGHDMITANRKNKSYVNFVNYAKMIFCANDLPQTQDTSSAFWNRWILLEFPYTFLPQNEIDLLPNDKKHLVKLADPEHINKLLDDNELSGLLNLSLLGLQRLFKNRNFSNIEGYNNVELKWVRASDSVLSFFIDCIKIDYDQQIEVDDMKKAYYKYCTDNKLKITNDKVFREKLQKEFPTSCQRIRELNRDYHAWQSIKLEFVSKDSKDRVLSGYLGK